MKRILIRSAWLFLGVVLCAGAWWGWRIGAAARTAMGGYEHLRYLLDSGESLEGAPAEDVLSDSYLLSLFGNNPDLVARLKGVIDLGMATDDSLKLGNITALVATYTQGENGEIRDPAVYVIGGFPDAKSERIGFTMNGYMRQQLEPEMWNLGHSLVNLLGRDVVLFCEEGQAEMQMARLWDVLNGEIMPLAQAIVTAPYRYAVVFPEPKQILPPNMRNHVQTIMVNGVMGADEGENETLFICPSPRAAAYVHGLVRDMADMARVVFHDRFGGYVKEMWWGKMHDMWWAEEGVAMVDETEIVQDGVFVVTRTSMERTRENFVLKAIERCGRDLAAQKAFQLAGTQPWEFVRNDAERRAGYWSDSHRDGADWPLGSAGLETPKTRAERLERERKAAEAEAAKAAAATEEG